MANRIHVNVVILALSLLHATLCLGTEEVKFLTEAGQLFRVVLHSEEKTEHLNAPVKGSSGSSEKTGISNRSFGNCVCLSIISKALSIFWVPSFARG